MKVKGALDPLETIRFGRYEPMKKMFRAPNFDENKIRELNFEKNNHIEAPPQRALAMLPNLMHINLSHNEIVRFDAKCFTKGAPMLKTLNLSYNQIDVLEDLVELGTLKKLEKIDFTNNPIAGSH